MHDAKEEKSTPPPFNNLLVGGLLLHWITVYTSSCPISNGAAWTLAKDASSACFSGCGGHDLLLRK
jgi:hypothetical protein